MSEVTGLSAKHEQQCLGSHNEPYHCLIIHSQKDRERQRACQAEEIRSSKMLLFVTDLTRGVDKVEAGGVQQLAGKRQGGRELERSGKPGRETARLEGDTERQSKEAFRE